MNTATCDCGSQIVWMLQRSLGRYVKVEPSSIDEKRQVWIENTYGRTAIFDEHMHRVHECGMRKAA